MEEKMPIDESELLKHLRERLPVRVDEMILADEVPAPMRAELIVVDAVKGFTREGALADPPRMGPMVEVVDQLAMRLIRQLGGRLHVTLVCDCHSPDIPEPPYPKHCAAGTDEPDIDPDLQWLASMGCATTVHKDCIDGLIGSIHPSQSGHEYEIHLLTLLKRFAPGRIIVVGDCTELCVTDLVSSLLSARNHGLLSSIPPFPRADEKLAQHIASLDICVYEPGCATYHLADRHPSDLAHHVGMWMMASRGARILKAIL